MSVEAIIFDLDGVIIDSEPIYLLRFQEFIKSVGFEVSLSEMSKMVGMNAQQDFEIVNEWTHNHFRDYQQYKEEMNAFFEKFPDVDYPAIKQKGLDELLAIFKSRNLKMGLASASSPQDIQKALVGTGVIEYFDYALSGHEVARSKPFPDVYLAVAKKLGVKPENCVVIEDSANGIKAGKNAGMFVVAKREERFNFSQDEADLIIDELMDFPFELLEG